MNEMTTQSSAPENKQNNADLTHNDVNEVLIQGKIVHKYVTDKATLLTINTGRATPTPNYPKVVFFNPTKDDAAKYEVGTYVRVVGNIQSTKRNPNIKNQMLISIFGESISAAETQFETDFGIPGEYAPSINRFKLAGRISEVDVPSKNIVRFTVHTVKNGRNSFVKLTYFSKDPAIVISQHLPGSFIRVNGSIQTTRSEKNGNVRYFQSYVASELH